MSYIAKHMFAFSRGGLPFSRAVISCPLRHSSHAERCCRVQSLDHGVLRSRGLIWRQASTLYSTQHMRLHSMGHGEYPLEHVEEPPERREKRLSRAKGSALGYIGRRSHSRKELEKKMKDRGHEDDVIQESLDRMQELGLQDDAEYALIFARSKWRQSKWSPRKIQTELRRKGVEEDMVDRALESVFGFDKGIHIDETDEDNNKEEAIELVAAAKRQYQSYGSAHISKEAKKRRLIGWLQRRGFTWDIIRSIVQSIEQDT
jgi:SOS response regulatory protein OraA/RecX